MINLSLDKPEEVRHLINKLIIHCTKHDPGVTIYLVGSYATGTYTSSSDLDILIRSQRNKSLAQHLTKILKKDYPSYFTKLDCKLVTKRDISLARNENYLLLHSLVSTGQLLAGNPITIQFSIAGLKKSFHKIVTLRGKVEQLVKKRIPVDPQVLASSLFSWGISLNYLRYLLTKTEENLSKIFTNEYDFLKKHYQRQRSKLPPIQLCLTQKIPLFASKQNKKSLANYRNFKFCIKQLRGLEHEIRILF